MREVDCVALHARRDGHERRALGAADEVPAGAPAFAGLAAFLQNGPGAVHGQGAVDLETHVIQPLCPDTLDRVAPDLRQPPAHFASGFLRWKVERMFPNRSGVYPWRFMMMYCCANVIMLLAIQ